MAESLEAITSMIADMTGRDSTEITASSRLAEDLRIKSANRVEIAARIDDELGAKLTISEVLKPKTVGELAATVDAKRAAA